MFPFTANAFLTTYIALAIGGAVTIIILVITMIMIILVLKKQKPPTAAITEPLYDNGMYESSSQMNSK